jgi:hypothetical protein
LPTGRGVKLHLEVAGGALGSSPHHAEVHLLEPATRGAAG